MQLTAGFAIAWLALTTLGCALAWTQPARRTLARMRHPLLLAVAAAVIVRLVPALMRLPEDALVQFDVESFRQVAAAVAGRRDVYDLGAAVGEPRYPYLPAQLYLFAAAGWIAAHTPLPYLLLVKLPSITADAGLTLLVAAGARACGRGRDAPALAMVFALNPVSVLVTGYHGQFDAIPAALVFGSWLAARGAKRTRRGGSLSALLLGLAVAFKTWPLVLAPVLLAMACFRHAERRRILPAASVYVATAALPVLTCLALYELQVPGGARHALDAIRDYRGVDVWGVGALIDRAAGPGQHARTLERAQEVGRLLLPAALACSYLACLRLRRDADRPALVLATVYAAATSWGWHWLSWLVPFALVGGRRWAAVYLAAAGGFTALLYLGFGGVTWGFVRYTGTFGPREWFRDASLALWAGFACVVVGTWVWVAMGPHLTAMSHGR